MRLALLGTNAPTGTAANTVQLVGECHHHAVVFVLVVVPVVLAALDQFEHFTRADLVAAAATNAVGRIQCSDEGGFVRLAASGDSGDVSHSSSSACPKTKISIQTTEFAEK